MFSLHRLFSRVTKGGGFTKADQLYTQSKLETIDGCKEYTLSQKDFARYVSGVFK